jgi:predicted DNA-binding ArsR family transcriptional regulator
VDATDVETVPQPNAPRQWANSQNLSQVVSDVFASYEQLKKNLQRMKALMHGTESCVDRLITGAEVSQSVLKILRSGRDSSSEATQ